MSHQRLAPLFVSCCLLALPIGSAFGAPAPQDSDKSFWAPPATQSDANAARYWSFMAQADALALQASRRDLRASPRRWGTNMRQAAMAIFLYEKAAQADPTRAEPHYRAALVSNKFQTATNFPSPSELDRAIAHLVAFERLAPRDPRLTDALFLRSLLRTKRGGRRNIELGILDYDQELALHDQSPAGSSNEISVVLSNRAELLMAVGRLDEAITGYQQAIAIQSDITYGYGLAVALDRDQQSWRARSVMRAFAARDPGNALHRLSTFFVPAGEVHYYEALRAESLGADAMARLAYKMFLKRLPLSPYAKQARANLAAIEARMAKAPAPKRARVLR